MSAARPVGPATYAAPPGAVSYQAGGPRPMLIQSRTPYNFGSHVAPAQSATGAVPPVAAARPSQASAATKQAQTTSLTPATAPAKIQPAEGSQNIYPDLNLTKQAHDTATVSDLNTSVGGTSRQQLGLERRVAWLEEDISVLQRRVRDEFSDTSGGAAGDPGLRALVARLDGELAAERRNRQALEGRLKALEEQVTKDNKDREVQLRNFSRELEATMRGLIGRIDEGLSVGAASMRERTDQTEVRLRSLIKRVDEGLSAGAAALQESLGSGTYPLDGPDMGYFPTGEAIDSSLEARDYFKSDISPIAQNKGLRSSPSAQQQSSSSHSRNRSPLSSQAPSRGPGALGTPSLVYPCTLQVPGSGLSSSPSPPQATSSAVRGGTTSPFGAPCQSPGGMRLFAGRR